MPKFRKKPIVIEAWQLTKRSRWDNSDWPMWMHQAWQLGCRERGSVSPDPDKPKDDIKGSASELFVQTLEGPLSVSMGDWIIQGIQGELYPCKPDIFEATYEAVED